MKFVQFRLNGSNRNVAPHSLHRLGLNRPIRVLMPFDLLFSIIAAPAINIMYRIKYPMTFSFKKIDQDTHAE